MAIPVRTAVLMLSCAIAVCSLAVAVSFPVPASSPPRGLRASERLDVYDEMIDARWDQIASMYPDADRPPVYFKGEVPTIEYDELLRACLVDDGLTITELEGGWSADVEPPLGTADLDVAFWQCQATYAYEGSLSELMSVEQRSALYDYSVGYLPGCYAMLGMRKSSVPPPDRAEFVAQSTQYPMWSPLYYAGDYSADDQRMQRRDQICPPEPAWRHAMTTRSS